MTRLSRHRRLLIALLCAAAAAGLMLVAIDARTWRTTVMRDDRPRDGAAEAVGLQGRNECGLVGGVAAAYAGVDAAGAHGRHQVGREKGFGAAGEAVYDDVSFGQRRFQVFFGVELGLGVGAGTAIQGSGDEGE